ncbi:5-dehydro-4-deoxyglucarate dehydratase [Peribacillus cavernae]|uniref:Probable 5-dehydro-4-deoxyglucarate dehydratase n=1 Tax=Peribacillus cavernae TaxID=1674310 RepID=A0A3S0VQJ8_9BACI|nr:5-dehydro-4-deoxyglucarate dehydratase [Peribacillus cavernae]MDQ0218165.1 5-dehydro-4-deoxyglucarate dehydratase [Peribacillus cavernae]RUQ32688.1 5-dehydro-4-deoxyglucarate dehydratase [Peribacillus cavernae]
MRKPRINGILGFPVAPFTSSNQLDKQALIENINFLIEGGLDSIFVCAGAAEFQSLSRTEYESIVEIAVSLCQGRIPVYTGVGGNIIDAMELARISEEKGADGYLILPPYLINGEQEGLYNYYKAIIETTEINAIIYQRDNAVLTLETVRKLSALPQLIGIKDGVGNMERNIEFVQTLGQQLNWINGMPLAEVTFPAYHPLGYTSYSSAISNYIPHVSRLFYNAIQEEDHQLINKLYKEVIFPINNIRKQKKGYAVSLIKAGMEIMGLSVGMKVRPPLVPVEKEHYLQLEKILMNTLDHFPLKSTTHSIKARGSHS